MNDYFSRTNIDWWIQYFPADGAPTSDLGEIIFFPKETKKSQKIKKNGPLEGFF